MERDHKCVMCRAHSLYFLVCSACCSKNAMCVHLKLFSVVARCSAKQSSIKKITFFLSSLCQSSRCYVYFRFTCVRRVKLRHNNNDRESAHNHFFSRFILSHRRLFLLVTLSFLHLHFIVLLIVEIVELLCYARLFCAWVEVMLCNVRPWIKLLGRKRIAHTSHISKSRAQLKATKGYGRVQECP